MTNILKADGIIVSDLELSDMKTMQNGAKLVYLNNKGKQKIIIQTPEMKAPYGVSIYKPADGTVSKHSVSLSFDMENEECKTLYDKMKEIEDMLFEAGKKNCKTWLGKANIKDELLEDRFSRIVSYFKDKETGEVSDRFPPTMKFKLPLKGDSFDFPVFDDKRNEIKVNPENIEEIMSKGFIGKFIIECTSIWFAGGKYGCGWKVRQAKIKQQPKMDYYAFDDEKKEEDTIHEDKQETLEEEELADSDDE